jgi:hypothetical protein
MTGLKELKQLKGLTFLSLSNTRVTDAGLKEVREALPECRVIPSNYPLVEPEPGKKKR